MSLDGYELVVSAQLQTAITKRLKSPNLQKALYRKIQFLSENPQHRHSLCKRLNVGDSRLRELGVDEVWEFRINLNFRCIFHVSHKDTKLIIADVGNHDYVRRHAQKN